MNSVELQGKITSIFNGKGITIITLFVKGTRNNFPQVSFIGADANLVKDFNEGDYVNVCGTVKVRGVTDKDGNNYFKQFLRGYSICSIGTEMSEKFGKNLGGQYNYLNEILIDGEIKAVDNAHGVINLLVKPKDEKFLIRLTTYTRDPKAFLSKYIVGSNICVKCELQTEKKVSKDKIRFFENLIIKNSDINEETKDID